ncbi:MAG TPA: DUF2007 domain-containing protein [Granulicella sp.]
MLRSLNPDPNEFVTVGRYMEPTTAQIAKGLLEAAGIECFLQGENANNMLALAFRARLRVRLQDEEAALDLLESAEADLPSSPPPFGGFHA